MFIQIVSNRQGINHTDKIWYKDLVGCVFKAEFVKRPLYDQYKIVGLPTAMKVDGYFFDADFFVFAGDAEIVSDFIVQDYQVVRRVK